MNGISRRQMLAAPLALAGCATVSPYFARTSPPSAQRLVYANGGEPSSLDPAQLRGGKGDYVVAALLESLTSLHPLTSEPAAGLATHYEIGAGGTRYTFFLRGHPAPRGTRLPNTNDLPRELTRGHAAPPDNVAALWSDGPPVTAHDFVFAWRRLAAPATAASLAFYLAPVVNAGEIFKGTKAPEVLGVRAIHDFAFQLDLTAPLATFLKILWQPFLAAVPRHAIERARRSGRESAWTTPGQYPSSGPFVLREWRSFEKVVLAKNPKYWEARTVGLEEILLLPIEDATTNLNLYQAGEAHSMHRLMVPPAFTSSLGAKKDFHTANAYRSTWYDLDITRPPLDRLAVRYALSLATDRKAIASFFGGGRGPACGVVPPMPGYPLRKNLFVPIDGNRLDLLSFDPRAARALLAKEGLASISLSLAFPIRTGSNEAAPIVQAHWREHLGVHLRLRPQEETAWEQEFDVRAQYQDAIEDSWTAFYDDPYDFLVEFGPAHYVATTWRDPNFDRALAAASGLADPDARLQALSGCEEQILEAMPVIPVWFDRWAYLEAPYLSGLTPNPFGAPRFKYAWIDTDWRPA